MKLNKKKCTNINESTQNEIKCSPKRGICSIMSVCTKESSPTSVSTETGTSLRSVTSASTLGDISKLDSRESRNQIVSPLDRDN